MHWNEYELAKESDPAMPLRRAAKNTALFGGRKWGGERSRREREVERGGKATNKRGDCDNRYEWAAASSTPQSDIAEYSKADLRRATSAAHRFFVPRHAASSARADRSLRAIDSARITFYRSSSRRPPSPPPYRPIDFYPSLTNPSILISCTQAFSFLASQTRTNWIA
uniref:Uncharacterized protein n=1 Tax=Plectus sambesii TaxID=2011161 RepID=A0A914W7C6_9BILA